MKWTKGNLIAVNASNCKVGAATDYGLYFHFGSLVGWKGGSNGDGTGTGTDSPAYAIEIQVKPADYNGSLLWPAGYYQGVATDYTNGYDLPSTDAPTTGIGDPCRYYLGTPWRTPTVDEWLTLLGDFGANTNEGVPLMVNNTALSFPASGYRHFSDGSCVFVGLNGYCWSSSVISATDGYFLNFNSGSVYPQSHSDRSDGQPVRCVAPL